jgi:hypothetical protein
VSCLVRRASALAFRPELAHLGLEQRQELLLEAVLGELLI